MRRVVLAALVAVGSIGGSVAQGPTPEPTYEQMVERLRNGDYGIDFRKLREAFVRTDGYFPYPGEELVPVRKALGAGRYKKVVKLADKLLGKNYVLGEAHLAAMVAHTELGNDELAAHHSKVAEGLRDSICRSFEGRTPLTPCMVITTAEEYFFIGTARLKFEGQTLSTCDDRPCDIMEVSDEATGEKYELYFDITYVMDYVHALLGSDPSD
jgi:hypothetical protein